MIVLFCHQKSLNIINEQDMNVKITEQLIKYPFGEFVPDLVDLLWYMGIPKGGILSHLRSFLIPRCLQ